MKRVKISVTVGASGSKVHPAFRITDAEKTLVVAACGCPHVNSGFKKLNPVADGWNHANCGNRDWSNEN